jgi:hypothetical protein
MKMPSGMANSTAAANAVPERCRLIAMSPSSAPPTTPFHRAATIASSGGKTAGLTQPALLDSCQSARKPSRTP